MSERAERCETCRYRASKFVLSADGRWRPPGKPEGITEAEYEARGAGDEASGECHRFPPEPGETGLPVWQDVFLTDWCGEWRAKDGAVLSEKLSVAHMPFRVLRAISEWREDIKTIDDLVKLTKAELLDMPNVGIGSVEIVCRMLAARGLSLRSE